MGVFVPLRAKDTITDKKTKGTKVDSLIAAKNIADTSKASQTAVTTIPNPKIADTIHREKPVDVDGVIALFQEWQQLQIINSASNSVSSILNSVNGKKEELDRRYKIYNMHILSLHKKFALAFSCIIFSLSERPWVQLFVKAGLAYQWLSP